MSSCRATNANPLVSHLETMGSAEEKVIDELSTIDIAREEGAAEERAKIVAMHRADAELVGASCEAVAATLRGAADRIKRLAHHRDREGGT